jgi:gliding motility-associated-like protein
MPSVNKFLYVFLTMLIMPMFAFAQLNADFTASKTADCPPFAVTLNSTSTGSPTSYTWQIGTWSTTTTTPSVSYTIGAPGNYTVRLTISNGSSTDVETKTNYITVYPKPSVNFNATTPTTGCSPLTVTFQDASTLNAPSTGSYSWFWGSTGSGANPTATFTNPGPQDVTLTVTNSYGCSALLTKTAFINVRARPVPSFSASPVDFCSSPCSTTFTGSATGNGPFTYSWAYGDGGTPGTGNTSTHTYTAPPNTWSPKLIVTDANGCKDSLTRPNYINIHYPTAGITSPASVCQKSVIGFTGTFTPAGGSIFWDFGDGFGTSPAASPTYKYNSAGTFTVTVTYNYRGCVTTASKVITVNPKPIADFTVNPDTLCPAPVSVQLVPNGSYATYYWNNGAAPPLTSTSPSPTFTYYSNGYFSPMMAVSTAAGCTDTIYKTSAVKIHDIYTVITPYKGGDKIDRAKIEGCKPLTIFFSDTTYTNIPGNIPRYYPYKIQSYDWDWGDNTTHGTLQHMSHTFVDTGVFKVILTVTTTKGCVAKDTVEVRVGQPPVPDFTASPLHICIRGYVQFTNLTTGPVDSWKWKFGEGSESTAKDPRHQYNWPDTMNVTLIATHKGCIASITKPKYIIVDSPKALFNTERFCDSPLKVRFHNTSFGHTSYKWFFGDPGNSTSTTDNDPYFRYPTAGTYNVTLVTYSTRTGCSDTTVYPLELSSRSMTLSANDTAVCNGDSVTFTSTLTGRQPLAYEFYLDNAYIGTTNGSIKWPIGGAGFHKVKVIAIDLYGCSDSIVKYNWIFVSIPTASFSASPTRGCIPFTVNFSDNSTVTSGANIINRMWNYGIGGSTPVTGTSSSYYYTTRGTYDIKLVITDNVGCKDSMIRTQHIIAQKPVASFTVKDTACLNETLAFNNISKGVVASAWSFGNGGTSSQYSPNYSYSTLGSFNVTLVVTDTFGCKDTVIKNNAVTTSKPFPSFTMSDSVAVCPPLLVKFTSTSTNTAQYYWRLGMGNTSTSATPSEFYTTRNKYRVTLVATDAHGCTDSAIGFVRILGYDGAFDYTPLNGCKPLDVSFNAIVSNVAKLAWDFDDGIVTNTTSSSITHRYDRPGAYVPRVIFEDANGCKSLSSGIDTIKVDAVEPGFKGDAPCQYNNVTLIDTSKTYFSSINYWKWTFDDGSTSTMKAPTHFYGPPGQYPVKLVVRNAQGCIDSITKNLTIHPLPVINAGLDTTICLNDTAQLNASGGISYIWNTTPYLSCLDCPDPKASPKEYFSFVVKGTDVNNCSNTDTVVVKIKTKVVATVSPDKELCLRDTTRLFVNGGKTYVWTPSKGLDDATSRTPVASPDVTTKYKVITYEGRCIPDTDFVNIKIHPLPDVTATGAATIIAGNSTILNATGNLINRFKWTPAESLNCADCPDPTAAPKKTTEYTITVYTDFGCTDSDKVTVKVLCDESQLFIPNTFTPNGDGQNDVFYPRGTGLDKVRSFRVYNRWGEVVFERTGMPLNDAAYAWDGTYKGATLPPDVFVYVVEALCESGETMIIKGDVTLIR